MAKMFMGTVYKKDKSDKERDGIAVDCEFTIYKDCMVVLIWYGKTPTRHLITDGSKTRWRNNKTEMHYENSFVDEKTGEQIDHIVSIFNVKTASTERAF